MSKLLYPRAQKLLLCTVLLLGVLVCSARFASCDSELGGSAESDVMKAFSASLFEEGEAGDTLFKNWQAKYVKDVPHAFTEEVMTLDGMEAYVSEDGTTIGFMYEGTQEQAFSFVQSALETNFWTYIDGGDASLSSFVKGFGQYRWLLLSTNDFDDETAVVVALGKIEEEK